MPLIVLFLVSGSALTCLAIYVALSRQRARAIPLSQSGRQGNDENIQQDERCPVDSEGPGLKETRLDRPLSSFLCQLDLENDRHALPEKQKNLLYLLLFNALLEIRSLCWEGNAMQAADLADAVHNLPTVKYSNQFSYGWLRCDLWSYQNKYCQERIFGEDYLEMLNRIKQEATDLVKMLDLYMAEEEGPR